MTTETANPHSEAHPLVRAEEDAILLWNPLTSKTGYVSAAELAVLETWAQGGEETGFIRRLLRLQLVHEATRPQIAEAIASCRTRKAPLRSLCAPESLHIELTTRCPLKCPQCYKQGASNRELPLPLLEDILRQASALQVFQIALGGGEPLLYPYLEHIVRTATEYRMGCSVTSSGVGLETDRLNRLIDAGVKHVQISLNGSTEAINALSREGYAHAMRALERLAAQNISFGINWVARKENLTDFPQMLLLTKQLRAGNINVLRYKPTKGERYAEHSLNVAEMRRLAERIRDARGVSIRVDSSFSNLLCHLNKRAGHFTGCGAGRRFIAVDAQGFFRPCSHVPFKEPAHDLKRYWESSKQLSYFRELETKITSPCDSCDYLLGCRGCRAIVLGVGNSENAGEEGCAFQSHTA